VPMPMKTKTGVSMLALDLPWRDLNTVDFNAEGLIDSLQGMVTPIISVGTNAILEAIDKPLHGFGRGKAKHGNRMVLTPGYMQNQIPGEPINEAVKNSGSGFKKRLGITIRKDPVLSQKFGKDILREYVPEHVAWWFNQVPMLAFAAKFTGEDLTSEQARAFSTASYMVGFRMFEFRPEQAMEMNLFQMRPGLQDEWAGRGETEGLPRGNIAMDADVMRAVEAHRQAVEQGRKKPRVSRIARPPGMQAPDIVDTTWPNEEQQRREALRRIQRGGAP